MFSKNLFLTLASLLISSFVFTQEGKSVKKQEGHSNTNKFRQMYQEFSSPNMFRTAAGAPGPAYYQQQADYKIDIELDDRNKRIYGEETITYTNNSPDILEYLWIQLDQNVRKKDSPSLEIYGNGVRPFYRASDFTNEFLNTDLKFSNLIPLVNINYFLFYLTKVLLKYYLWNHLFFLNFENFYQYY